MIKQIILLATLSFTATTYACSCKNFDSAEEYISNAEIIFTGTVTSVLSCELETDVEWRTKRVKMYTFKVLNAYKGIDEECVEIITGNPFGGCGDHFNIGEKYVIFASNSHYREKNEGMYETSICAGNGPVSEYSDFLETLKIMKAKGALKK